MGKVQYFLREFEVDNGREFRTLFVSEVPIADIIFSPSGEKLAVIQNPSTTILNISTGQALVTLKHPQIGALVFSQDSGTVAGVFAGEGVRAWDAVDGRELWSISIGSITQIAFSSNSHKVAVAPSDGTIRVLDSATGREEFRLTGNTGAIRALSFTPDDRQLLTAGDDTTIRVWNLPTPFPGQNLNVGRIESPVQLSPDRMTLLTSTGSELKLWDLTMAILKFESRFPAAGPLSGRMPGAGLLTSFSIDGDRIGSARRTDDGYLIDYPSFQVQDSHTGEVVAMNYLGSGKLIRGIQLSPTGNKAALVASPGAVASLEQIKQSVELWDLSSGKLTARWVLNGFSSNQAPQFSPDGKLLAISLNTRGSDGVSYSGAIEIYDGTTGTRRYRLNVGGSGPANGTFSRDGNSLLLLENGKSMSIWDFRTGKKLVSFPAAGKADARVMSTDFSLDGTRLVSVLSDGEVWLWDTKLGKALIPLRPSSGPYEIREVTVIADKADRYMGMTAEEARLSSVSTEAKQYSVAFSNDGNKITLTTITPNPKGSKIQFETWDGTPRSK
jgi:WD40 repeat protein